MDIITKNKQKFLQSEKPLLGSVGTESYSKYVSIMEEFVRKCEKCGVYYWDGYKKRCKCK